ncbi:MAG TPA: lytic transglycosylase domain-containing protein [Solirubrobacteraceae bacterium]|jgi:membrane-bound lytic murein transglycosylase B
MFLRLLMAAVAALALVAAGSSDSAAVAPEPDAPIPREPHPLATRLTLADASLRRAIEAWRLHGNPAHGPPPQNVILQALYVQRVLRTLSRDSMRAKRTIRRLPPRLARSTREITLALRDLRRLSAGWPPHRIRTGPPEPLGALLGYYREAQRRFGVGRHVLAAVNLVESAFGRLRNNSVAGARGPMQFIPATWRAYGLGGDINDPRDAILGAANYLRRSGAPGDYAHALHAYNPSPLYVNAVRRYARLIDRDREAVYALYSWQVFVKTRDGGGEQRVTGPGLR